MNREKILKKPVIACFYLIFLLTSGCLNNVSKHINNLENEDDKLTLGIVQKEIKKGMAGAEVVSVLGSPNMVTKDKSGAETWIYDKMSTEYAYSKSKSGISTLIIGVADVIGGATGGTSGSSGASKSSQRTLTVIIKFLNGEVNEYTYHASSF